MVSIIIPVYNEEKIIAGQLRRLSAVTDTGTEVIAVDGGSTDRTPFIIEGNENVTLLRSPRKGRAFQMNYGASFAKGDVLLFLHADAMLPEAWISEISKAMESGCVAGGFRIKCGRHEPLGRLERFFAYLSGIRSRYAKYMYGDQAIFVKKNAFESVSGFPEIPIMEDYEFSRRISETGKIYYSRQIVDVSYRRFKHGTVTAAFLMMTMPSMYRLGVSPGFLAGLYRDIR
jgi:rSAM/selenodomain-associated transferase 2